MSHQDSSNPRKECEPSPATRGAWRKPLPALSSPNVGLPTVWCPRHSSSFLVCCLPFPLFIRSDALEAASSRARMLPGACGKLQLTYLLAADGGDLEGTGNPAALHGKVEQGLPSYSWGPWRGKRKSGGFLRSGTLSLPLHLHL